MSLTQSPDITDTSILETMCFIQRHHVPLNLCAYHNFTTIAGFLRGVPIMMSDRGLFPSLPPNTIVSSFSWYKTAFNVLTCGQMFIYFDRYLFILIATCSFFFHLFMWV